MIKLTEPDGTKAEIPDNKMKPIVNPKGDIVKVSPKWYDVLITKRLYKKPPKKK